jgi:hypothetical protein
VIAVPALPDVTVFDTVTATWLAVVNVNVFASDDTTEYTPDAAFFAVTVQLAGAVAFKLAPVSVHPVVVPDNANVTPPVPDPPLVVSVTAVPAAPDVVPFEIVRADWGPVNVNVFVTLVAEA